MDKNTIKSGVSQEVIWWLGERHKKLVDLRHETMSVNPFLIPLIFGIHQFKNFDELSEFLVSSHLYTGYATGFGKLIDEKILPKVFGTIKLDKANRSHDPFSNHVFDEIDHVILPKQNSPAKLLSLKAGRWTIQLTMAVQLNRSFDELIKLRDSNSLDPFNFDEIAVGVFYGTKDTLTDKYDILRGINRGANHNVYEIMDHVNVYAGREFWAWLNHGETATQDWVLEGIIEGFKISEEKTGSLAELLKGFHQEFSHQYAEYIAADNTIDWQRILTKING